MSSLFSDSEITFSEGYVNTYLNKGYSYYVVQTVSEYNNAVDLRFYFSKEPITFTGQRVFTITDGIRVDYDSSNSYNDSSLVKFSQSSASGSVTIGAQEDVFSNAVMQSTSLAAYPELDTNTLEIKSGIWIFGFITVIILFLMFVSNWLRGR